MCACHVRARVYVCEYFFFFFFFMFMCVRLCLYCEHSRARAYCAAGVDVGVQLTPARVASCKQAGTPPRNTYRMAIRIRCVSRARMCVCSMEVDGGGWHVQQQHAHKHRTTSHPILCPAAFAFVAGRKVDLEKEFFGSLDPHDMKVPHDNFSLNTTLRRIHQNKILQHHASAYTSQPMRARRPFAC